MDNTSEGLVENTTVDNPAWQGFYYTHFNAALRPAAPYLTWRDLHVNVTAQNAWGAGQYGYSVGGVGHPLGTANLKDCEYNLTAQGPDHRALFVANTTSMTALNADGLSISNHTSLPVSWMVLLEPRIGAMNVRNVTVNGVRQ